METKDYLRILADEIKMSVVATTDDDGEPVTCAIDMMDSDADSLYFLTAKGKNFYKRLIKRKFLALTAMKGADTMHTVAISLRGKVRELGYDKIPELFSKNPFMYEIYPDQKSMHALSAFQIYEGSGEWFDLSKKPIERASFVFGTTEMQETGYYVDEDLCIGCGACLTVCPQDCIDLSSGKARIVRANCLHCGNCMHVCPVQAVKQL